MPPLRLRHLAVACATLVAASAAAGCKSGRPARSRGVSNLDERPLITSSFSETFDRPLSQSDWNDTSTGSYRVENGTLRIKGAYNHPLWLLKRLPRDVQIDLDITSHDAAGDLKVEFFGDGVSFAPDKGQYTSSGYVAIFGGWHNTTSTLVRQFEHDPNRRERTDLRVVPGQTYHWTIKREGTKVSWAIDNAPFLEIQDLQPLYGTSHWFFGFDNWEVDTTVDNLRISALAPSAPALPVEDPATAGR